MLTVPGYICDTRSVYLKRTKTGLLIVVADSVAEDLSCLSMTKPRRDSTMLLTAVRSLQKGKVDSEVDHMENYKRRSDAGSDGQGQWVCHAKSRATNRWRLQQTQNARLRRRSCQGDMFLAACFVAVYTF